MKPTPRQQQILDMRASGMTAREIADKLGITPQSVKDHCHQAKVRESKQPALRNVKISMQAAENRATIYAALQDRAMTYGDLLTAFPDITPKQIEKACARMSHEGAIKSYRRGQERVWAASKEVADRAFEQSDRAKAKAQQMADEAAARQRMAEDAAMQERMRIRRELQAKATKTQTARIVTVRPSKDGVTIKTASGGEAIIPEGLMVQVIKPPPGRFDVTLPKGAGVISQDWKARRLAEVQQ